MDGLLKRVFFYYVGEAGVKHDSLFARGCWEDLLVRGIFEGVTKLYTSGDGGSHFRCYKMLYF
jgi:hypothetical protein